MPAADVDPAVILRRSWQYTLEQLVSGIWRVTPTTCTTGRVGRYQVTIGADWEFPTPDPEGPPVFPYRESAGTDITEISGVLSKLSWMSFGEPFGEIDAGLQMPRFTIYDKPAWLVPGANIDIFRVVPDEEAEALELDADPFDGLFKVPHWHGFLANDPKSLPSNSLQALGAMYGEILGRSHQPPLRSASWDVGTILGHALNPRAYARPFNGYRFMFESATTGIELRLRGSRGEMVIDHVDQVLAQAIDSDGQWTISRAFDANDIPQARKYYLRRKGTSFDVDPIQANTITAGGYGVSPSLHRDLMSTPNAYYGEGVTPRDESGGGGDRWRNMKYPGRFPAQPAYPDHYPVSRTDAGGDEDGDFTAPVVTRLQYALRLAAMPYAQITGTFDLATEVALKELQRQAGLTVTGAIAGDSDWDAVWDTTGAVSDLDSGYARPLSEVTESSELLYAPNGAVSGFNNSGPTAYDGRIRVERTVSHGKATKTQGITWSRHKARQANDGPARAGSIVLTGDPEERSRHLVREGSWTRTNGIDGGDPIDVYLAAIRQEPESDSLPVQLTVADKSWDLLDLRTRLDRDLDASTDPASSVRSQRLRETKPFAEMVGWDKESGAGIILPFTHSGGGTWVVQPFIGCQDGRIIGVELHTSPAVVFAAAVFAKEVTAEQVADLVPDPLVEVEGYASPFKVPDTLKAFLELGGVEIFGTYDEPGGYSPGEYARTAPLTGDFTDTGSWDIYSFDPPGGWVAWFVLDATETECSGQLYISEND